MTGSALRSSLQFGRLHNPIVIFNRQQGFQFMYEKNQFYNLILLEGSKQNLRMVVDENTLRQSHANLNTPGV